jgi:hypothetical protein
MSQISFFNFLPRRKFIAVAGLLLSFAGSMLAQNPAVLSTVSPYSRFGIGDFIWNGSVQNTGMGGGGIGLRNDSLLPQYINLMNPASLTGHPLVAYEVALFSHNVKISDATGSANFNRTTLSHFAFAFPVTKWWGAGFGLVPYSQVGYNLTTQDTVSDLGTVTYKYEGSGGVNQVYFANGFRPFAGAPRNYLLSSKYDALRSANDTNTIRRQMRRRTNLSNISVGVNTSWLFGSMTNVRRDVFQDTAFAFNTKITKRTTFRDWYFTYGIQYSFRLKKSLNPLYVSLPDSSVLKKRWFKGDFSYRQKSGIDTAALWVKKPGIRVNVGLLFSLPTDINITTDLLAQTYKQFGTIEQIRDTIVNDDRLPGRITLPAMAGFGFSLKKDFKWTFQADYLTQFWSGLRYQGEDLGLKNSQRFTAGFQYQPKQAGRGKFMTVTQYRLGFRYYQTYLELKDTRLNEMSVNFSMSVPAPYRMRIGEPVGRATLTVEYGIRGTTSANLVREDFLRVTFGFTVNDRWFSHYKYD